MCGKSVECCVSGETPSTLYTHADGTHMREAGGYRVTHSLIFKDGFF